MFSLLKRICFFYRLNFVLFVIDQLIEMTVKLNNYIV